MMSDEVVGFRLVARGAPVLGDCVVEFVIAFDDLLEPGTILEERDEHGRTMWVVSSMWARITDDFGQQLLNRRFVKALLQQKPLALQVNLLCGATLDFVRIASYLGLSVSLWAPEIAYLPSAGTRASRWLADAVRCASSVSSEGDDPRYGSLVALLPEARALPIKKADFVMEAKSPVRRQFGYEAYAFSQRDHALLFEMQRYHVDHFSKGAKVLDLGCGTGVFLEALSRVGIDACGVERNDLSVRYARGLGHEVIESGALEFLEETQLRFSGIYCSHFVEHLPFDAVERLIRGIARVLSPGGVAVFVFPDPESIRSQFLGFWRDPEHVRFYHPDLIELVCWMNELECEYQSQRLPHRKIVSFDLRPPWADEKLEGDTPPPVKEGFFLRLLRRLGVATVGSQERMRERLDVLEARDRVLRDAVSRLWDVNQTWAWEDNAVMRFRKPGRAD